MKKILFLSFIIVSICKIEAQFNSSLPGDNVGIGTDTALDDAKLTVKGNPGSEWKILALDGKTDDWFLGSFGGGGFFIAKDNFGSTSSRFTIINDKIGIGTNSPNAKLTIVPGAVSATTLHGKDFNQGVTVETTSGRTGYMAITENDWLNGAGNNGHFVSAFPFNEAVNRNDDSTWKAFRLLGGSNLEDRFWVDKSGSGFFDGNVGIGTTSPSARLHVQDNRGYAFGFVLANTHSAGHGLLIQGGGTTGNRFILQLKDAIGNDRMTIHDTGEVGIGTISTGSHKLAVEGSIGAREVKVQASGWSDFVFEKDYDLKSLEEVESHIAENGHLPEIPSQADVEENGINLGEMDAKLLQKIEELTLYLIEQNKQNKVLQNRIEQLEKKLAESDD